MKRKMVMINEDKCNGCGLCITGCHEGALQLINGKAKLVSDSYCDGLGACLPACPMDAISLEEREADPFDEEAVKIRMEEMAKNKPNNTFTCPGTAAKKLTKREPSTLPIQTNTTIPQSELRQWPCQIKLVPINAPYFQEAHLLIAADCTSYAYANFHQEFMRNKITLIGCPKLDAIDYAEKLTAIISQNELKSVTVVRMEVPCCSGLENAAKQAIRDSCKMIPWNIVTISTDGVILEN
ncbi:MAG: ferredoxin [Firmicutes bacterium HGW-Firmicutes-7]|nr:MAG: ferredoxin [Firmicutes bacterium HGW-Firmicutes-7]